MSGINLKSVKKPFFLGIGGIGISAIARMFQLAGKQVAGSDLALSEVTEELEKLGIKVSKGQGTSFIPQDTDLIIYTVALEKYAKEFLAEVKHLNIPMLTYPEVLHLISKDKFTIAVSGTHGKTTTTAMIAKIMVDAGLDPTVIVGSFLHDSKSNFIAGRSKYLVVEACEYNRSFLQLEPDILVIANIDNDHLDYYKDTKEIASAFNELVLKIPKDGYVVCNRTSPYLAEALVGAKCITADREALGIRRISLKLPGAHNFENAKSALAVAKILGVKEKTARRALAEFSGTWRRFEYKGETLSGALVYDDYGHHPTEIRATLKGARELYPNQKLIVVFQPHLYSRTKLLLQDFAQAFGDASGVILAPIYPAREPFDPTVSSDMLAERIRQLGQEAKTFVAFSEIESYLNKQLAKGDILITMGAGETNKIADALVHQVWP